MRSGGKRAGTLAAWTLLATEVVMVPRINTLEEGLGM